MPVTSDNEGQAALSLFEEGIREADRYKWIVSEKRGRDMGAEAFSDWFRKYWLPYCRYQRLEHVTGRRRWAEFPDCPSLFILQLLETHDLLLELILDRLLEGWENLDLITWGVYWGLPTDQIVRILEELNINAARLDPMVELSC